MKLTARFSGGALARRFARLQGAIEAAALDAAADALAAELSETREREMLSAPLLRGALGSGRFVGADDSQSVAREFGTPTEPAAPWFAPFLPIARAPMRAAAFQAAARALSRSRR